MDGTRHNISILSMICMFSMIHDPLMAEATEFVYYGSITQVWHSSSHGLLPGTSAPLLTRPSTGWETECKSIP